MTKRKRRLNFNDIERWLIRAAGIIGLVLLLLKLLLSEIQSLSPFFR